MSDPEANAAQRDYWNAARHWVDDQAGHDEMLEPLGRLAQAALAPSPGERILDIGCGTGATTLELADAVGASGAAVGADVSALLLEVARGRASGRPNVSFVEGDAQVHPFESGSFDGAFSRFGVMFFADPVAAFANIGRALRPGGRLAFVCWQAAARNEWVTVPVSAARAHVDLDIAGVEAGPNPFAFADEARLREVLSGGGFEDVVLEPVTHRVLMGGHGDADTGVHFILNSRFGKQILEAAGKNAETVVAAIREALGPHVTDAGVEIDAAVWVALARRP